MVGTTIWFWGPLLKDHCLPVTLGATGPGPCPVDEYQEGVLKRTSSPYGGLGPSGVLEVFPSRPPAPGTT